MAGSELRIRDNIFLASVKLHMHLARDLLSLSLSLFRVYQLASFFAYTSNAPVIPPRCITIIRRKIDRFKRLISTLISLNLLSYETKKT